MRQCLHKSFESLTLKVLSPFYGEEVTTYCDGSRVHGCQGCFCREMNYDDYRLPCKNCGKMFLELFDILWTIRQKVYSYEFAKSHAWEGFFQMEYEVEEIVSLYFMSSFGPESKKRSIVLGFYKQLAEEAKEFVMAGARLPSCEAVKLVFSCSDQLQKLQKKNAS
jgi:hypothetical protein